MSAIAPDTNGMRVYRKRVVITLALMLGLAAAGLDLKAQSRPRRATRRVSVYMWATAAEDGDRYNLAPVQRMVYWMTPARGAIEALIAGPDADERREGFRAPHTEGLSLEDIQISNGTAMVSLKSGCPECGRFGGPKDALRFRAAIELTLKQFPSVRRVRICLDGYEEFHESENRKRCRR